MKKSFCTDTIWRWLLLMLAGLYFISGCALTEKAWNLEGSMYRAVGAPVDLAPIPPAGAKNVQKVGNKWFCELDGKRMVFNDAAVRWEPQ